jgi:hypothetical protein
LGGVCDDLKVLKVRNWKKLAMDRKVWNDLSGKAKTHSVVVLMEEEECWYNCFRPTRHMCWRDLDCILYTLSRVRTLFVTRCFFPRKVNVFLFLKITFPLGHMQNVRMRLEILSQTLVPNKYTIQRLVERFHETGSIGEKRRSGRHSVLSNDSLEDIRARLLQSPRKSLRKLSQRTGMTSGSRERATERLKLHPYRVHVCHELNKMIKRKGCVTADGSNNLYEMV